MMNFFTNSNSCKLQLNQDGNYLASQPIDGQVKVNLQSDLKCRGIKVELLCNEYTNFPSKYINPRTGKPNECNGKDKIFWLPLWLYGADNESHKLQAGTHTYPFAFHLPPNLPGSIQFNFGKIVYKIKAIVVIPFSRDIKDIAIIQIESPVDLNFLATADDLNPSFYSDEKTVGCWCFTEGEIKLEIELPRRILIPNEEMTVVFKLSNMSNMNVCRLELELLQILKFKTKHAHKKTKIRLASIGRFGVGAHNEKVFSFNVHLPEYMLLPNLARSTFITAKYQYEATAFLPSGHKNMILTIPILVGDIPLRKETAGIMSNPRLTDNTEWLNPPEEFIPSAPPINASEEGSEAAPPSYMER